MNIADLNKPLAISFMGALAVLLLFTLTLIAKGKKNIADSKPSLNKLITPESSNKPDKSEKIEQFQVDGIALVTDPLSAGGLVTVQINAQSNTIAEANLFAVLHQIALTDSAPEAGAILKWLITVADVGVGDNYESYTSVKLLNFSNHPTNGFAGKFIIEGKLSNVLFGETDAIARSTAQFHPEIVNALARINRQNHMARLLAIDGLVYLVINLFQKY